MINMDDENIELFSWILRGKQRRELIREMNGIKTPTQVAKNSGYSLNHASKVLNDFKKKGIVECLNPSQKTGRLYQLTSKGKVLFDKIQKS
jgi:predicted transcriptional regulator